MDFLPKLFFLPLIGGPILVVMGVIMLKFPPKRINALYGYRTPRSMKSQERWEFAQKISAHELIRLGLIYFASAFLGLFFKIDADMESNPWYYSTIRAPCNAFYQGRNSIEKKVFLKYTLPSCN